MNHELEYQQIIQKVVSWAEEQEDINTVLIVGSRARQEMPADKWSDLDLTIFCTEPKKYLQSTEWLEAIDEYWLTFIENTAVGGGMERRVLFRNSRDVDFAFFPTAAIEPLQASKEAMSVLHRGFHIALDKGNLFSTLLNKSPYRTVADSNAAIPFTLDQQLFNNLVQDYLYHGVLAIKKLMRGEVWQAKAIVDIYMKRELLQLLVWQAKSRHGASYDTWHDGRFLNQWADAEAVKKLPTTFAQYERESIGEAVINSIELMSHVAQDIATRQAFIYPIEAEQKVLGWIKATVQQ